MKTSRIGVVLAAISMVVAGVGIGMAQAGGNPSDSPAWSIDEQIETGNLPESDVVAAIAEQDGSSTLYAEHQPVLSFEDQVQLMGPVETGSLPDMSPAADLDHTDIPREGNVYQYWGADNPSN